MTGSYRRSANTETKRIERQRRKRQGLPNFLYARYCDDFVVLCDGSKSQAKIMRQHEAKTKQDLGAVAASR